jgi:hypothetical protein
MLQSRMLQSGCAFLFAALGLAAIRTWTFVPGRSFGGIPVSALYFAVAFAPFWLIDATLLRPLLRARVGWGGLAALELAGLMIYRCLLQATAIRRAPAEAWSGIVAAMVGQACLFYAFYLAATLVLSRLPPGRATPAR